MILCKLLVVKTRNIKHTVEITTILPIFQVNRCFVLLFYFFHTCASLRDRNFFLLSSHRKDVPYRLITGFKWLSLFPLPRSIPPGPSASEVMTLWCHINMFLIIINSNYQCQCTELQMDEACKNRQRY